MLSLSTGPKTVEGKAKSSRNSIKHGIFCKDLLLPGEDEEALRQLRNGMLLSYNPKNEAELMLVDRIIDACWRLHRVRSAESQRLTQAFPQYGLSTAQQLFAQMFERVEKTPERYQAYTTKLENQMHRAINQLRAMRKEQQQQNEASELTNVLTQDEPIVEQTIPQEAVKDEAKESQVTVKTEAATAVPVKDEPAPAPVPPTPTPVVAPQPVQPWNRRLDPRLRLVHPMR